LFLCLLVTAVALVAALHVVMVSRQAWPIRRWIMTAASCAVGAVMLYVWGLFRVQQFTVEWDDICRIRYDETVDAAYGQVTLWPIGRRCNEHFDVVPGFVTPAIVVLAFAAVGCAALALRARHRRRRHQQTAA
jgi:hypothetical protein